MSLQNYPQTLFADIHGQQRVKDYLIRSIENDCIHHAYLFLGQTSSQTLEMALAFVQGLMCPNKLCGVCKDCNKVARSAHPDVHILEPEGAKEYLLDQIRELIADSERAPVRGDKKVYIINEAERLSAQSANALLKTLEEPPHNTIFILLAHDASQVLPTIVSRCQLLLFKNFSSEELRALLVQKTGVSESRAKIALAATGMSVKKAQAFLLSPSRPLIRQSALTILIRLNKSDELDILTQIKDLLHELNAPISDIKAVQEGQLDENKDFLSPKAQRDLEAQFKRKLTASQRSGIIEVLNIYRSFLRDCLLYKMDPSSEIINEDVSSAIMYQAETTQEDKLIAALERVNVCESHIVSNVSSQLALEALLFDLKKVL
ncbi:MAG: DNA polymerase III subunit delta' [Coriobacteriia bacterium]|nr:DNA polymerase III subunit delta' [Coriobacteriia bacterium]